jgi:hypothetical protein
MIIKLNWQIHLNIYLLMVILVKSLLVNLFIIYAIYIQFFNLK